MKRKKKKKKTNQVFVAYLILRVHLIIAKGSIKDSWFPDGKWEIISQSIFLTVCQTR
jgi:hypothetical protein